MPLAVFNGTIGDMTSALPEPPLSHVQKTSLAKQDYNYMYIGNREIKNIATFNNDYITILKLIFN